MSEKDVDVGAFSSMVVTRWQLKLPVRSAMQTHEPKIEVAPYSNSTVNLNDAIEFSRGVFDEHCWRSLERQFTYSKRTDRVAFPLEYSPKVYQSTEQVYYYA